MNIILASGSPRRRELLTRAQVDFTIMGVDINETPYDDEHPKDYIQRMVAAKAAAAVSQISLEFADNNSHSIIDGESFLILTADTIGVLPDGKTVLVKPTDFKHAQSMWQQMSDSTHQVWTAVQATLVSTASLDKQRKVAGRPINNEPLPVVWQKQIIESTEVSFVPLTRAMMEGYWDSGEPADKAGGYGIQGLAAAWVTRINGSYTNVVGLPLAQTLALIDAAQDSTSADDV